MTRAAIKQSHVMYVLGCGHVVLSAPSLVSARLSVWCPQDNQEWRVTGVHKYEWRATCPKCHFARWCGTSEMLAQQMANAHHSNTQHRARTEYVINPSAVEELIRLTKIKAI
jgi:hypothetical protein